MSADVSTDAAGSKGGATRRRPSAQAVADVVLTVLLLALFGWAIQESTGWSFRTALFPRIVTGAAFALSALHLVKSLVQLVRETRTAPAAPDGADPNDADPDDAEYVFRTAGARRWASALGWVVAFVVLLQVGGLFVTASLFSLLYLRFGGGRTWRFSAVYAVVIGVVLYAAFELALDIPSPPGLFLD